MPTLQRLRMAAWAAGMHSIGSLAVALLAAGLVFVLWYPYPYRELAGGRDLFTLVLTVDAVCGPLLTLVLFNPQKPRKEMRFDIGCVVLIQSLALGYGLWTVWQARPLFLVLEVDRYRVIAAPDVDAHALATLPTELAPHYWGAPRMVGIRAPKDATESNAVLFQSAVGGRDFGARPEFFVPYTAQVALESLKHARSLAIFLEKHPDQREAARALVDPKETTTIELRQYLPVIARQDWIAVITPEGRILGFLPGDGF